MVTSMVEIKKTPFYNRHLAVGAKMVEFAGYLMPVQYQGMMAEHQAVRQSVGLFDLSHMGEFIVRGAQALIFLQRMTTNDVGVMKDYQVQYNILCYDDGGIVDDLLIYKLPDSYFLVVNGANIAKDLAWLQEHLSGDVQLEDVSEQTGLLAIQGPRAQEVMKLLTAVNLDSLPYYHGAQAEVCGREIIFSRTGYTGEDGFELYIPGDAAEMFWERTMVAGQAFDIIPVGLGARDSLRLEMKYSLYGNDIDQATNPLEAGLGWVVKPDKGEFVGRDAILRVKADKPERKLVALMMEQRAVPRQGYPIIGDSAVVGRVTSGIFSPSLGRGIALGYVRRGFNKVGTKLGLEIRDRMQTCEVIKPPFYKQGTHR